MNSKNKRIQKLADVLVEGAGTADHAARLSELLRNDPAAQEYYLDCIDVHAMLSWQFRDGDTRPVAAVDRAESPELRPGSAGFRGMLFGASLLALVAAVLLTVFAAGWLPGGQPADAGSGFCQLTQVVGGRWESDAGPREGDRLGPQRLKLETGMLELVFDNGVKAVLAAPVDLELIDAMSAYLHRGRAVFRVPPPAIGFTVETNDANVMDLGTEFGVRADAVIGTELQVFEGEVVANGKSAPASASGGRRLEGGQAVRFGKDASLEDIAFWPDRFARYLPDPRDPKAPHDDGRRKVSPYNEARYDEIHIVPAPAGVVIDGRLDDWDLSGQFTSRCEAPYDAFYHVKGSLMYDEEYLYIGAIVGDPFPMRSTVSPEEERNLYGNGGCLAFRISTDREMGWPVRGQGRGTHYSRELVEEDYNNKLAFLVLWHYGPEGIPCLNLKYGMDQHGKLVNPAGYKGAYRKHEDGLGYTAEYAIPWSLLNAAADPPRAGDVLGFTWLVHWAGPEGRSWRGQLIDVVNPAVDEWNFQNAATWGRAVYHDQGNLPRGTVREMAVDGLP